MKTKLIVTLLCMLATCVVAEETHLFILSGQSNMSRMKEAEGFLPEARKLLPGAKVEYVKIAHSGKPIRNWLAEWDQLAQDNGLDPVAIRANDKKKGSSFYDDIMEKVKPLLAEKPASITFVWMQGESDAKHGAEKIYEQSLAMLIARLRKDLNCPEMNVVIGRISDFGPKNAKGKTWPGWLTIRAAQENIVKADPRAALVSTDDCNGPRDSLHCPPEGYELMGRRMARQAVALIQGRQPDPTGAPAE